jgi:hypothetical protein
MRWQSLIWIGVLAVASAIGSDARVLGQDQVKVQVTVPAVPNIGVVAPSQAPSELAVAPRGVIYIGYRGAYRIAGAGHEGHAMFRDSNNQFWDNSLTYYGMSNGYWIASVNGAPDTYLAFQATPTNSEAPYFKVLIHTPSSSGYVAWDEATRGNAQ